MRIALLAPQQHEPLVDLLFVSPPNVPKSLASQRVADRLSYKLSGASLAHLAQGVIHAEHGGQTERGHAAPNQL